MGRGKAGVSVIVGVSVGERIRVVEVWAGVVGVGIAVGVEGGVREV